MKTDRENLVKLILEKDVLCDYCGENTSSYCAETLADYLISKGVTIPVRCGECKWGHKYERWDGDEGAECGKYGAYKMANSFCSYGERKEDAD